MEFKRLKNKSVVYSSESKKISNQNDIVEVITTSNFSTQDLLQIFQSLVGKQQFQKYTDTSSIVNRDYELVNQNKTSIKFQKDEGKQGQVFTHSVYVNDDIVFDTTLFEDTRLNKRPDDLNLNHTLAYLSQNYFGFDQSSLNDFYNTDAQNIQFVKNEINKYYQYGEIQQDDFTIIGKLTKPPQIMKRYVKKDYKNLDIVVPSQDLFKVELLEGDQNQFNCQINYNLYNDMLQQGLPNYLLWPSCLSYEFHALRSSKYNLKKFLTITDTYRDNTQFFGDSSLYYVDFQNDQTEWEVDEKSQCIQLKYDKNTMKKVDLYFTLQDKLGYYNSLIKNYGMSKQHTYRLTNEESQYDVQTKPSMYQFGEKITNIFALSYFEQNINDDNYGFLNEIGDYKISFNVKIKRKNLKDNSKYLNDNLFKVRMLPINGLNEFSGISNDSVVSIFDYYQVHHFSCPATYYLFNSQYSRFNKDFYTPLSNFIMPTTQTFNQNGLIHGQERKQVDIPVVMKQSHKYNFMFDRYGQFLTYRNVDENSFSYKGKNYIDTFSQVLQIDYIPIGNEYKCQVTLKKKFQGNSLLSFMVFQEQSGLIASINGDKVQLTLRNVNIQKID